MYWKMYAVQKEAEGGSNRKYFVYVLYGQPLYNRHNKSHHVVDQTIVELVKDKDDNDDDDCQD